MTEFQKIYAPRPVKANSNIKCLKCNSDSGNLNYLEVFEKTFPLFENKPIISESRLNNFNNKARKIKAPKPKNHKFLLNNETFEHFCEQLEKDFEISKLEEDELDIKEEIFSILKCQKSNLKGNCNTNEVCSKYSTLPERSKNPLYKIFEMESGKKPTNCFSETNTNEITLGNYFLDETDESFQNFNEYS